MGREKCWVLLKNQLSMPEFMKLKSSPSKMLSFSSINLALEIL